MPEAELTYLPVVEAAQQAGVSASAVRNYIAGQHVRVREGKGPRGTRQEVALEDVVARAQATGSATAPGGRDDADAVAQAVREALVDVVATRDVELSTASARLENLHGQLRETGERAARAEVRLELLGHQLDELRAERDALREQVQALNARPATPVLAQDQEADEHVPRHKWWERRR